MSPICFLIRDISTFEFHKVHHMFKLDIVYIGLSCIADQYWAAVLSIYPKAYNFYLPIHFSPLIYIFSFYKCEQ